MNVSSYKSLWFSMIFVLLFSGNALSGYKIFEEKVGGKTVRGISDDVTGETIIKAQYDSINYIPRSDGLFKVSVRDKSSGFKGSFFIIDKDGNRLTRDTYQFLSIDYYPYIFYCDKDSGYDNKCGVLEIKGQETINVIDKKYRGVGFLSGEKSLEVRYIFKIIEFDREKKQRFGLIDINGDVILDPTYHGIKLTSISENKITVLLDYGKKTESMDIDVVKYNKNNKKIKTGKSEESVGKLKINKTKKGEKIGFVYDNGTYLIEPTYDDAWDFVNGYARVKRDNKWGFINDKGKQVIEPIYDYVWDYGDGKAKVRIGDDVFYINGKNEKVN